MNTCPYCNAKIEIYCDDKDYDYDEYRIYQHQCRFCGKTFIYTTHIEISHECSMADCLNEGEHTWKPTATVPKYYTAMECTQCHKKRMPTNQEREEYGIPLNP